MHLILDALLNNESCTLFSERYKVLPTADSPPPKNLKEKFYKVGLRLHNTKPYAFSHFELKHFYNQCQQMDEPQQVL